MSAKFKIFLIAVSAFTLRCIALGKQSLWTDEAFSVWTAGHSPAAILQILKLDAHPPLFYFWLHLWMKAGTGEAVLRFPSTVLGALNCVLIYWIGKSLFNARIGLWTALFWAYAFMALDQETQVRMYVYATTLSLAATLSFLLACREKRISYWIAYFVFGGLALYTHYFTVFILSAHLLFLVFSRRWKALLACAIVFGLEFSPCFPLLLTQLHAGAGKTIPLTSAIEYFMNLGWMTIAYHMIDQPVLFVIAAILGAVIAAWGLGREKEEKPKEAALALLLFVIPYFLPFVLSLCFGFHLLAFRYLVLIAPYYFLLIALGLSKLPKSAGVSLTAALIAVNLGVWFLFLTGPAYQRQNWRDAARIIRQSARPGDAFFVEELPAIFPLAYYLPDWLAIRSTPAALVLISKDPQNRWFIAEGEKNLSQLQPISRTAGRIWLIWFEGFYPDPHGVVKSFLESGHSRSMEWRLRSFDPNSEIYLYLYSGRR